MASNQIPSEIRTLLRLHPLLQKEDGRRAISLEAGLDEELFAQIEFDGPTAEFLPLFLDRLSKYGTLKDGGLALQALLEAVKNHVGVTDKEKIDRYLAQLPTPEIGGGGEQRPKRNWRWIFVPVGLLAVTAIVLVIASQRRTIPSSLAITQLADDSKFEDDINDYHNGGAIMRRADPTLIFSVKAVETSIAASTKKFTWVLSTTKPGISIDGRAFKVTSRGMTKLTFTGGNENTLEFLVDECDRGDGLVAVVRIGWHPDPALNNLTDITHVLQSKAK